MLPSYDALAQGDRAVFCVQTLTGFSPDCATGQALVVIG